MLKFAADRLIRERPRSETAGADFVCELFDEAWETSPRLWAAGVRQPEELFDSREFERSILADANDHARTGFISDGVARPIQARSPAERLDIASRLYADGCSLLLTRLEHGSPSLERLCRGIDLALLRGGMAIAAPTSANGYLGPPGASGFPLHYDDHCGVVIQLSGSKRWTIHEPSEPLPEDRCERPLSADALGSPCLVATLAAGDMLYVPRGFPHAALAGSAGSLHVTLALRTVTWRTLGAGKADPALIARRSARPGRTADALRTRVTVARLAARRATSLAELAPLAGNRFAAIDALPDLRPDTLLAHAPHVMLLNQAEDEETVLRYPGGSLRMPVIMAPVFEFIAGCTRFALSDLPECQALYDKRELARALVRRGVLVPASGA